MNTANSNYVQEDCERRVLLRGKKILPKAEECEETAKVSAGEGSCVQGLGEAKAAPKATDSLLGYLSDLVP